MRSGLDETEAICSIGKAEVFVAITQCDGITDSNWNGGNKIRKNNSFFKNSFLNFKI